MSSPSPSPFFFLLPLSFSISVPGLRAVAMATVGCRMCDGGVWGSPPVILTSALPESNKAHPPPSHPSQTKDIYLLSSRLLHDIIFYLLPEEATAFLCFCPFPCCNSLPPRFYCDALLCCARRDKDALTRTSPPSSDFSDPSRVVKMNLFTQCARQSSMRHALLGRNMCSWLQKASG